MAEKSKKNILVASTIVGIIIAVFSVILINKYKKQNITRQIPSECRIDGCNQEICLGKNDESISSECIWKEEYSCYKTAKCEVQNDRKCGWTQTNELKTCLSKY